MTPIKRFLNRRARKKALTPIVGLLPHLLKDRYGGSDVYTPDQVRVTCDIAGIEPRLVPLAVAALCAPDRLPDACPDLDERDRDTLRQELVHVFGLEESRLNGRGLLLAFPKPIGRRGAKDGTIVDEFGGGGVGE